MPLWRQIYRGMADAIERGAIAESEKLPSVRELAGALEVSRAPVENAYVHLQLDGLIEGRPKSGYFALKMPRNESDAAVPSCSEPRSETLYDLSGSGIDPNSADIPVWRKHLRAVLNMHDKIISSGDPQGEAELRNALVSYCFKARGVKASADRIVIASGTQQLLTELCRMTNRPGKVGMEPPGYAQGERVFRDFGWDVIRTASSKGSIGAELGRGGYDLFADITSNRPRMLLSDISRRRRELLEWADANDAYILEDDFNGEIRYLSRQIPSLQGARPERVIYIGSFSRLLLPSVRIAYMVLPAAFAETAKIRSSLYDQTSSKIEQLALARYIKEGHLERHIKRIRKTYQAKSEEMLTVLKETFGGKASCKVLETSLAVAVTFRSSAAAESFLSAASKRGVVIDGASCSGNERVTVTLSFSGIRSEKIAPAVRALHEPWYELIV